MKDDDIAVYGMRDFNERTAEIVREVCGSGKPAFLTRHGRFIAVIQPLEPGQLEQQVLAAMAREIAPAPGS